MESSTGEDGDDSILKIDPRDGRAYSESEFLEHYHDLQAWDIAKIADDEDSGREEGAEELRQDPNTCEPLSREESHERYGNYNIWDQASRPLRRDLNDNQLYTQQEFYRCYKTHEVWDISPF